jgi:hypothetical protein
MLTDVDQFDEYACELYNPVVRPPGMAVARADREAEAAIEFASRVEVADGMHDMVKTVRHWTRPQTFDLVITSPKRTRSAPAID